MFDSKPPSPPRVRKGTSERLQDALVALSGGRAQVAAHRENSWASITFAGARHQVELAFDGAEAVEAGEQLISLLPDHEFDIPGQLVAEATVTAVAHQLLPPRMQVTCEVLMLEDA